MSLTTSNNFSIWAAANSLRCPSGTDSPPASHLFDDDTPFVPLLDIPPTASLPPVSKQGSISRLSKTLIRCNNNNDMYE